MFPVFYFIEWRSGMKEVTHIILNKTDLKQIIAEKFDVDSSDVDIEVSTGDPQYPSCNVYATVYKHSLRKDEAL